jgi:hypothetical protein
MASAEAARIRPMAVYIIWRLISAVFCGSPAERTYLNPAITSISSAKAPMIVKTICRIVPKVSEFADGWGKPLGLTNCWAKRNIPLTSNAITDKCYDSSRYQDNR